MAKGNIIMKCWVNAYRCTTYENNITKKKMVSGNRLLQSCNFFK